MHYCTYSKLHTSTVCTVWTLDTHREELETNKQAASLWSIVSMSINVSFRTVLVKLLLHVTWLIQAHGRFVFTKTSTVKYVRIGSKCSTFDWFDHFYRAHISVHSSRNRKRHRSFSIDGSWFIVRLSQLLSLWQKTKLRFIKMGQRSLNSQNPRTPRKLITTTADKSVKPVNTYIRQRNDTYSLNYIIL